MSEEKHRKGLSEMEWAEAQPKGRPNYFIGDIVKFKVGGYGIINEVSKPRGGWPSSYATDEVEGLKPHRDSKVAWHYEGDFTLHAPSAIRGLKKAKP